MNLENSGTPVGKLMTYLKSKMQTELTAAFNININPMLTAQELLELLLLAKPGDTWQTANWIDSGYGRAFKNLTDKEGLPYECTVDFFKQGRIMLDPSAFFENQPGNCFFEVAANSVIVPFSRQNFNLLQLSAPEAQALATNILAANAADALEKTEMLRMKGQAKYDEFIRIFGPAIELHFAQKDIASYLGFTPQYLSGLRSGRY